MQNKTLTTWEAACIITGYGIGAGVLSMPYLANIVGFPASVAVLFLAFIASYVLHLMIAELAIKTEDGGQIISCLSRFLFRGRFKKPLSVSFFVLMALILCTNLATYIAASEEIIVALIPVSPLAAKLIFYVLAASVVFFGLKVVGISEKYAVSAIIGLIALLALASCFAEHNPVRLQSGTFKQMLAYFGLAMFAMSAFFSVPQAVAGLGKDEAKIKKAVFIGLGVNFMLILVISFCTLWASARITEVAMVGWSEGIGLWAQLVGSIFTLLAMLTTYWSLSLALAGIIGEMTKLSDRVCWLIATLPSMVLVLFELGDFMELLRTAGGLIAIVVAVMVVPAYRNARREVPGSILAKSGSWLDVLIIAAYILMAVGSVVTY